MIWTTVIVLLNLFNFVMFVARPAIRLIFVWLMFRKNADHIEFLEYKTLKHPFSVFETLKHPFSDLESNRETIKIIKCRMFINDEDYFEWNMSHEGKLLTHRTYGKLKGKRECLLLFKPKKPQADYEKRVGVTHELKTIYSLRGPVGFIIRRHTAERFVMAKIAGFETHPQSL